MAVSKAKPYLALLAFTVLLFPSCKDKHEAEVPAFLSIPSITLTTDNSTQGSAANGIADAWILVDGKLEGVFGLPVNIPLLYEGQHKVEVYAGVRRNGSASYHIIYPLYKSYISNVNFVKGETVTLNPEITYTMASSFDWLEDFEDQSTSLVPTSSNTVDSNALVITNDPQYVFSPGPNSAYTAKVEFSSVGLFEVATKDVYELPLQGAEVYLELNIKTNIEVAVGLVSLNSQVYERIPQILVYNTNGEWKKFYISLKETLAAQNADRKFKISIAAFKQNAGGTAQILIDNFKLVHLE